MSRSVDFSTLDNESSFFLLQVRIDGRVEKLSETESKSYFNARPADSQISATISKQSQPIPSREVNNLSTNQISSSGKNHLVSIGTKTEVYR